MVKKLHTGYEEPSLSGNQKRKSQQNISSVHSLSIEFLYCKENFLKIIMIVCITVMINHIFIYHITCMTPVHNLFGKP